MTPIRLISIQFHGNNHAGATLPLRRQRNPGGLSNETDPVALPEWRSGVSKRPEDSPVALCRALAAETPIHVHIVLERDGSTPDCAWIRANDNPEENLLGSIPPKNVEFGGSTTVEIVAVFTDTDVSRVATHNDTLTWEWSIGESGPWQALARTRHQVYVTLDVPHTPWDIAEVELAPWIEVLRLACSWAAGAKELEDAASRITRALYMLGEPNTSPAHFAYESTPQFTDGSFDLAKFLAAVRGGPDLVTLVNCSDCATIVSTLANALGNILFQATMGDNVDTRPLKLIGQNDFAPSFFGYHELAWGGCAQDSDPIWDGCLMVDRDHDPSTPPFSGVSPTAMVFGKFPDRQYSWRLVSEHSACGLSVNGMVNDGFNRPIGPLKRRQVTVDPDRMYLGKWFFWNFRNEQMLLAPWSHARFLTEPAADLLPVMDSTWRTLPGGRGTLMRVRIEAMSSHAEALCRLEQIRCRYSSLVIAIPLGDAGFGLRERTHVSFVRGNLVIDMGAASPLKDCVDPAARSFDGLLTMRDIKSASGVAPGIGVVDLSGILRTQDPAGHPLWFRVYSDTGEIRAVKDVPNYYPAEHGLQTIHVYEHDREGRVTPSTHTFEAL